MTARGTFSPVTCPPDRRSPSTRPIHNAAIDCRLTRAKRVKRIPPSRCFSNAFSGGPLFVFVGSRAGHAPIAGTYRQIPRGVTTSQHSISMPDFVQMAPERNTFICSAPSGCLFSRLLVPPSFAVNLRVSNVNMGAFICETSLSRSARQEIGCCFNVQRMSGENRFNTAGADGALAIGRRSNQRFCLVSRQKGQRI